MQETVRIFIRPTETFGGIGNHMWAVYTNSSGQSYSLSGWSNTQGSILSGWGTIDTQVTSWGPGAFDWEPRLTATASQVIATGSNLSSQWNSMVSCANSIDAANLGYDLLTMNSNSVVNTCLVWAGLPAVSIDSNSPFSDLWTPGGTTDLRNYLDGQHGPNEPDPLSSNLDFYTPTFGFGGDGGRFSGFGGIGGGGIGFGGSSGRWVYSSVQLVGGPVSAGWHWVEASATRIKPVVLDLEGDGVELTPATSSPGFDFFQTGEAKTTGWFKGGDGLLVYDGNQNGLVDNGSEISFLHHSPSSSTDLQALAAFDSSRNGKLDSGDALFGSFRIWRDVDFDGRSDPGELLTISSAGVSSINLQGSGGGYQVNENDIYAVSTFTRSNGSTGRAYDVGFEAFSRGSKLLSQSATWAVLELETGERLAAAKPGTGALTISNATSYTVNGVALHGYQLSNYNDSISIPAGYGNRAPYVDGAGGSDTINLSASSHGSVVKGGSGDDTITGTRGNDFIAPGTYASYIEWVRDDAGNDYYLLEADSYVSIDDRSGTDVAVLQGYSSGELLFASPTYNSSVFISTNDGARFYFEYMISSSSRGIEYLVLDDKTLTRSEIISLAQANPSGGDTGGVEEVEVEVAGAETYRHFCSISTEMALN